MDNKTRQEFDESANFEPTSGAVKTETKYRMINKGDGETYQKGDEIRLCLGQWREFSSAWHVGSSYNMINFDRYEIRRPIQQEPEARDEFVKKYGFQFFDAFQDENAFKHSARNKQEAALKVRPHKKHYIKSQSQLKNEQELL